MNKPVIAAQLYTLRDFLKEKSELGKTFSKLKSTGYDYAQISGVSASVSPVELRDVMLSEGVEPIGAHIGLDAWRGDQFGRTIASCHAYGIKYAAIPWLDWNQYKHYTVDEWIALFGEFEEIASKAAKDGITVQYHNHDFEFSQFGIEEGKGGKTLLEILFERTEILQAEPDFGWVMRGGADPVQWARKMKGRMDQVHLKDWSLINGEFTFRALGEGRINWPDVIAACIEGGTHTFIVEQDTCNATGNPFASLGISRRYLEGIFA